MIARSPSTKRRLIAPPAGGLFFPQRVELGLDTRAVTPELTRAIGNLGTEIRSFERTSVVAKRVLGVNLSDTSVGRIVRQLGTELSAVHQLEERSDGKEVVVPQIATVSCDGGRIRTRQPGQGRGVTLSNESGGRETKNALFEKMSPHADHQPGADSCPAIPDSFRSVKKVANIAEKPAPDGLSSSGDDTVEQTRYEGPTRLLRTALSGMLCPA